MQTNFTEREKTYYLIAKTTCTDLPKASNFYITVETPGSYTYKLTAKELNDSNGIYVCTYRTISSTWTKWEKVCTTTVADVTKTNLTLTSVDKYKFTYETNNMYLVKNGICYVKFDITAVSPVSANASTSERKFCTLPKASMDTFNSVTCYNSTTLTYIYMQVGSDGYLSVWGGTAEHRYIGSFSYPVAE